MQSETSRNRIEMKDTKQVGAVHILRQPKSGVPGPPLPPLSAIVSIWLTPPPPLVSNGQLLAYPPPPFVSNGQHLPMSEVSVTTLTNLTQSLEIELRIKDPLNSLP